MIAHDELGALRQLLEMKEETWNTLRDFVLDMYPVVPRITRLGKFKEKKRNWSLTCAVTLFIT